MRKFLTIISTYWQRALTYRFTVLSYRAGEMLEMLALILMWAAIYGEQELIKGFTLNEMITYVLIGNLVNAFVRNFLSSVVARDIKDGELSMFLVKPLSYFTFILVKEIGRISLATFLSVVSQLILIAFFFKSILFNFDPLYLMVIMFIIVFAFIIELLIAYLVGLVAFWTDEVDGIFRSVERLRKFFSGGYFPLSLLPVAFVNVSLLLPFAYSFFVPAQLYLKKMDLSLGLKGIFIQMIWIILLYGIITVVWKRGLKRYEGVGI